MQQKTTQTSRFIALLLFVLAAGLYLQTLAPELLDGDSGEFQFAAWRLGLAHPTGYPLYLLLGSLWQHGLALFGVNPASALNAFSALIGAGAVALLYLLMQRWLRGPRWLKNGVATFTALFLAFNPTFWSQNLIAEVYTLHVLFLLIILWVVPTPHPQPLSPGERGDRLTREGIGATLPSPKITLPPNHLVTLSPCHLVTLSFLVGLALTHHAMTLWLLPGLLLALHLFDPHWWRSPRRVGLMLVAGALPFLLYLYIPLRSGPLASPWYHQRLGSDVLTLYDNTLAAFLNFISGRSIAVGFYDWSQGWANLAQAWLLWRLHLLWAGLALALWGLYTLFQQRQWTLLALTLPYFLLQQLFNLFYAIGDILVYYIPLYLIAILWAGFGVQALLARFHLQHGNEPSDPPLAPRPSPLASVLLLLLCFLLPLSLLREYYPKLDQSSTRGARQMWEAILAAQPPPAAILVSNDRNEIVPLFYLQAVENRGQGITGLFPLIKPEARFADIGATVETALAAGQQPVYLIKAMPGLEVKFKLEPATPPLVRVTGMAASAPPQHPVEQTLGVVHLLGYDWQRVGEQVQIDLHWSVLGRLSTDYTTSVQLFDAAGERIAQDDRPPGGVYYPTSLWKAGETLVERHLLTLPADRPAVTMLVDLYAQRGFVIDLGEPLRIGVEE